METYSLEQLRESGILRNTPVVFTVGVFDSVHIGHAKIIETLVQKAEELGALSLVMTFSVNPKGRINDMDTARLRRIKIESLGVDLLTVIDFSPDIRNMSAIEFLNLIKDCFKPIHAVAGPDFVFGRERTSGRKIPSLFGEIGIDCGLTMPDMERDENGVKISSTGLRELIETGDIGKFSVLSGQFYRVDLLSLKYKSCSGGLEYDRVDIHQILPAMGVYEGKLVLPDNETDVDATITETSLSVSFSGKCSFVSPDSIILKRRK